MTNDPGIHNPRSIDLITMSKDGAVVLVMVEAREWEGTPERILQLQEKVNHYLAFALDGDMVARYPETAGKPVRLRIDCDHEPDEATLQVIARMREQISPIQVAVRVR